MAEGSAVVTVLIYLPVFYNPDRRGRRRAIEDEKFDLTVEDLTEQFQGGGTLHLFRSREVRGFWWDRGIVDRDVLALLEIDVPDTAESREWLDKHAQDVLVKRFRQKAIYMKFVRPVETLLVTDVVVVSKRKIRKQRSG